MPRVGLAVGVMILCGMLAVGCEVLTESARSSLENMGTCRTGEGVSACGLLQSGCAGRYRVWETEAGKVACRCCDDPVNPPD